MNMIKVQTGDMFVNTYIVHEDTKKECIVIDPGGSYNKINEVIKENNLNPKYILITHGHFDHIGAVNELKKEYDVKVAIHKDDAVMLYDATKNLSAFLYDNPIICEKAEIEFDEQKIELCGIDIEVLHTPGHSPGGCTFLIANAAFTGDTLFDMSIGRSDFLGCDEKELLKSLKKLKLRIPMNFKVFPGHGNDSVFGYQVQNNPFLR